MKKLFTVLLFSLLVVNFTACVKMRDYTGVKDGHFGLDVEKPFGEGQKSKSYLILEGDIDIIAYDTKDEILRKIGDPDSMEPVLGGFECWTYNEKSLKLYFDGEYLKKWNKLN